MSNNAPVVIIQKDYPARRKIVGWLAFLIFFLLISIGSIIAIIISHKLTLLAGLTIPILCEIGAIAIYYKYAWGDTPWREGLYLRKISVKEALKGFSIGLSLFIGLQLIAFLISLLGVNSVDSETSKAIAGSSGLERVIVLGFLAPIIAPFTEELFFRGFICGTIYKSNVREKWRPYVAAITSAGLFALVHFQGASSFNDLLLLVWIFLVGFIHSKLLMKYNSVLVPFFSHLGYNGITTLIMLIVSFHK